MCCAAKTVQGASQHNINNIESCETSISRLLYYHCVDALAGGVCTAGQCCCLLSVHCMCMEPAQGATCWLPPSARTAVPAIKDA